MRTHLDLFSGIGGFALAAKWAGFTTLQFVEKNSFCQRVLGKHWPMVPVHDDIKTFQWHRPVDLITGGFPCQPFSVSGKKRGKNDNRYLWDDFYRIIRTTKPRWIVIENVRGLISLGLDDLLSDLAKAGYETGQFVLPACAANAPHRRDRLWIVAYYIGDRLWAGFDHREVGQIWENFKWDAQKIQSEWEEWKPDAWEGMQAGGWLKLNAHASRTDDGVPNRVDRLRSLGNAIVPQVVFPILRSIYLLTEKE